MRVRLVRGPVRAIAAMALLAGLAACGHAPTRPAVANAPVRVAPTAPARPGLDPCAPTRVHLDSDYTPGGLYAPGVADGGPTGPIDVDRLVEPTPRREPRSRTGNRSPYTVLGKDYRVMDDTRGFRERGIASWYGTKFNGRATSSGELYDICSFTAAHKTLPLPSYARVTNLDNGRTLVVRVNDRGPFHEGRVMDLSYAAAVRLGVSRTGTARVEIEALDPDAPGAPRFAQAPGATQAAPLPRTGSTPMPLPDAAGPRALAVLGDDAPAPVEALPPTLADARPAVAAELAPSRSLASPPSFPSPPALGSPPAPSIPTPSIPPPGPGPAAARVQVGAFGDEGNARRLADRLAGAGLAEAVIDTLAVDGRTLWRVSVGTIDDAAAAALVERLRAMGLPGARVLRR
jgi:rare lipoprotein A